MISDVLSEAVAEIDRYLTDEAFKGVYVGPTREDIVKVRDAMEAMRARLDLWPTEGNKNLKDRMMENFDRAIQGLRDA